MSAAGRLTRQTLLAVGIGLVFLFGFAVFAYFFILPILDISSTTGKQPVPALEPTQVLTANDLQSFQLKIGPLLTTEESQALRLAPSVRNLALIRSNGKVQYSTKSFLFNGSDPWQIARPLEVTGVLLAPPSGFDMSDSRGSRYSLNVTQPFVFEGKLTTVYVVDKNGELWSAELDKLQLIANSDVLDSSIQPNPNLSLSFGN